MPRWPAAPGSPATSPCACSRARVTCTRSTSGRRRPSASSCRRAIPRSTAWGIAYASRSAATPSSCSPPTRREGSRYPRRQSHVVGLVLLELDDAAAVEAQQLLGGFLVELGLDVEDPHGNI